MTGPEFQYGEDLWESRSELREAIWEISGGRCEHPAAGLPGPVRCPVQAVELAHIRSIGMGGRKSADCVNNTMAACRLHARSTDDLSSPEWQNVPSPHDTQALAAWVLTLRRRQGWAL